MLHHLFSNSQWKVENAEMQDSIFFMRHACCFDFLRGNDPVIRTLSKC